MSKRSAAQARNSTGANGQRRARARHEREHAGRDQQELCTSSSEPAGRPAVLGDHREGHQQQDRGHVGGQRRRQRRHQRVEGDHPGDEAAAERDDRAAQQRGRASSRTNSSWSCSSGRRRPAWVISSAASNSRQRLESAVPDAEPHPAVAEQVARRGGQRQQGAPSTRQRRRGLSASAMSPRPAAGQNVATASPSGARRTATAPATTTPASRARDGAQPRGRSA